MELGLAIVGGVVLAVIALGIIGAVAWALMMAVFGKM